ncbi:nuclear transport factor 2 family protein [Paenibacillus sp. ATY16]|uniref:nuclear transport factor 2 family protein n=1 Tax=Paenibacillus sp. ATY16 TaxID=1759312 RepID=UPI00200BABCF|nr:nuclear transport factor 2 family protein [Paenibacillus sp. ATY16]MCK9861806.1 nuclear transport factor 2 family protein [Paenibacillus sp. ATY16]
MLNQNQQNIEMKESQETIREQAQETFRNHLKHLSGGNIEAWVDLWQEDGVLEFPYGPAGFPDRKQGKAELFEYMQNFPKHFEVEFTDLVFHPAQDPELTIAEFKSAGKHRETGNPYNQTYISVVRTKDGLIESYRDFWNPLVAIESVGSESDAVRFSG